MITWNILLWYHAFRQFSTCCINSVYGDNDLLFVIVFKQKLVSTWKRYWFVLKGQLLLYYKTQHECNNLSVCRGSLNMGLASCVRPGANRGPPANGTQGCTIEVVTRTQVILLVSTGPILWAMISGNLAR